MASLVAPSCAGIEETKTAEPVARTCHRNRSDRLLMVPWCGLQIHSTPRQDAGMVEDDPAGPFTVRATNPKLDPPEVIEVCHSKSAMQTRAGRLYQAGYEVEVDQAPPAQGRVTPLP